MTCLRQTTGSSTLALYLSWQAKASAGGDPPGAAATGAAGSMRTRCLCPDANQGKEVKRQNLALPKAWQSCSPTGTLPKGVIYQ
jgi:hypothetical protein